MYTSESFRKDENLVPYFKDMQKPFLRPLGISLYVLYHLRLLKKALVAMQENQAGTKNLAVCSMNYHNAHEPHGVLNFPFAKDIMSGAGLTGEMRGLYRGSASTRITFWRRAEPVSSPSSSSDSLKEVSLTKQYSLRATYQVLRAVSAFRCRALDSAGVTSVTVSTSAPNF